MLVGNSLLQPFSAWAMLAYGWRDGPVGAIESGGIYAVEALGAYTLGRALVIDRASFERLARCLLCSSLVLVLLAVPEMLSGKHFVHDIAGAVLGNRPPTNVEGRFGMARAYGPFDHPILYGT